MADGVDWRAHPETLEASFKGSTFADSKAPHRPTFSNPRWRDETPVQTAVGQLIMGNLNMFCARGTEGVDIDDCLDAHADRRLACVFVTGVLSHAYPVVYDVPPDPHNYNRQLDSGFSQVPHCERY